MLKVIPNKNAGFIILLTSILILLLFGESRRLNFNSNFYNIHFFLIIICFLWIVEPEVPLWATILINNSVIQFLHWHSTCSLCFQFNGSYYATSSQREEIFILFPHGRCIVYIPAVELKWTRRIEVKREIEWFQKAFYM